jgi:hypothetical protein
LGLKLVSLEEKRYCMPKWLLMVGENKYDGTGYPFKNFLEEPLMQQRNEMMDSFVQILRRLPTSYAYSLSRGTTPFKVQIKFDIPIFEGHIDADAVDKWLNLQKGIFLSIIFQTEKRLCLHSSNLFPMSKIGGRIFVRKRK